MNKLNQENIESIIKEYQSDEPMNIIADRYSVTRQTIWKIIKKYSGLPLRRSLSQINCHFCGKTITTQSFKLKNITRKFCNQTCYVNFLKGLGNFKEWRQGQRIARSLVSLYFPLNKKHVVHHIDGDDANNTIHNLCVFANQGDHVRYHRGFPSEPIWRYAPVNP